MDRVAIIGAGVMGRTLAINILSKDSDLFIDIYDKEHDYRSICSYCAGGMLSPISELINCDSHVFELGKDSIKQWQNIQRFLLKDLNDGSVFVRELPTYVLSHNSDRSELNQAISNILFRMNKLSEVSEHTKDKVELISKQDIDDLQLTKDISEQIIKLSEGVVNVSLFFKLSNIFIRENKNITYNLFSKEEFYKQKLDKKYCHIFDCTGLDCKDLDNVYGIRGESLIIKNTNIKIDSIVRLLHPRHSIYLIPRGNGVFYLGSSTIHSQDTSQISVQSLLELLSSLMIIDQRFAEARVIKSLVNVRPVSVDDKPIIKTVDKVTYLNGLSRHGYLFAPTVSEIAINNLYKGV